MKTFFASFSIAILFSVCFSSCKTAEPTVYSAEFNDAKYVWEDWGVSTNSGDWTFEPWDGKPWTGTTN